MSKVSIPCPRCEGLGYNVERRDDDWQRCVRCATCSGSGQAFSEYATLCIETAYYESGLTAHGCLDTFDSFDKEAVERFGKLIARDVVKPFEKSIQELAHALIGEGWTVEQLKVANPLAYRLLPTTAPSPNAIQPAASHEIAG
jgi:hypothetical protein